MLIKALSNALPSRLLCFSCIVLSVVNFYNSLNKNDQLKMNFYKTLLLEEEHTRTVIGGESEFHNNTFLHLDIKQDENGIFLSTKIDTEQSKSIMFVHKNHFISGCIFFPLKEYFLNILKSFCSKRSLDEKVIIPHYLLVYQLLYYRFGNDEKARKYYEEAKNIQFPESDDFFMFKPNNFIRQYLQIMQMAKENEMASAYFYTEEELKLATKLQIPTYKITIAREIFRFVREFIRAEKENLEVRWMALEFVEQEEAFNVYADAINRKGINIRESEHRNIYSKGEYLSDYVKYNNEIAKLTGYKSEECVLLVPLVDLLRHQVKDNATSNGKERFISLDTTVEKDAGIVLKIGNRFKKNSILGYSFNYKDTIKPTENLYIYHGIYSPDEYTPIRLQIQFHKNMFSEKKAKICMMIGCGGFNAEYFIKKFSKDTITHPFDIDSFSVNSAFKNILKIISMDDSKLKPDLVKVMLQNNLKFSNIIEEKAIQSYISLIKSNEQNEDTVYRLYLFLM